MSAPQWKPGDVGMARRGSHAWHPAMFVESGGGQWWCYHGFACQPTEVRPLVVLDPEDAEQVERLVTGLRQRGAGQMLITDTQASSASLDEVMAQNVADALRSLIAPPKPDEPQGLGAVVKDSTGQVWVRFTTFDDGEHWAAGVREGTNARYEDIAAVEVLSDGVQP